MLRWITLAVLSGAFASTVCAQSAVAVEGVDADPRTACTAEGSPAQLRVTCPGETIAPMACTTIAVADLLEGGANETLVRCGEAVLGESTVVFAVFAEQQLRFVLRPSFEYFASVELVDLVDREASASRRYEVVVHLGSEDGSHVVVLASRGARLARVFRAYLGGGGDPVRDLSFVLNGDAARIELRRGRGRPEVWHFDAASFAYVR